MRQAHHEYLFINIFLIVIIGGGKGREMEWRGGRGDGGGDGTVCEGIVPLGDQRSGKTEGFGKVFVSHPVPSHGKFSKDEEGWGGPPTAWEGALRSILKWMIAVGMAGIKLIGLSKGIQHVRKGYD